MFPQSLERDLGVRDGAACGGAERIGDLRSGEPVAGDLEGLAEVEAGVGDGAARADAGIAVQLGGSAAFDEAISEFAGAFADQNERDYAALAEAVATGRVTAAPVG